MRIVSIYQALDRAAAHSVVSPPAFAREGHWRASGT